MVYRFGKHSIVYSLLLIASIFSIITVENLDRSHKSFLRNSILVKANEDLSLFSSQLQIAVSSIIYNVSDLSTIVAVHQNFESSSWPLVASNVIRKSPHIDIIGIAPNDVIEFIYPLQGNEKALGLDYKTVPEQWRSIKKAKKIKEIFIAGPVDLVQGGRALIARLPIYTDPPYNHRYWGVCSVVISLSSLLSDAGVASFESKYNLAIRGADSEGVDGALFYGEQSTFDNAFAIESVHFNYGSWGIAASTKHDLLANTTWSQFHMVRLVGYPVVLLALMSFIITYQLYIKANTCSLKDELTLLPNRRYFMHILNEHFEELKKGTSMDTFAILNIDLDHFKAINDTYGHIAGDKVLIETAKRLKNVLRMSDVVARFGGDEFLVLLSRIDKAENVNIIKLELQQALSEKPVIYDHHRIDLEGSIGYAIYHSEFKNAAEMLKLADQRMYEEKHFHKQRVSD